MSNRRVDIVARVVYELGHWRTPWEQISEPSRDERRKEAAKILAALDADLADPETLDKIAYSFTIPSDPIFPGQRQDMLRQIFTEWANS